MISTLPHQERTVTLDSPPGIVQGIYGITHRDQITFLYMSPTVATLIRTFHRSPI